MSTTHHDLVHVDHGQPRTTSRRVAQRFGKRHDNVLRSIRTLCEDLPPGFARLNFEETTSTDEQGRKQPEYLLTAYFSDRGRPFQADRGRQIWVAVGSAGEARRNWFECS